MESPRKGLSDMDVARAVMGQGWPFTACPWSGDGAREPRRSRGRMVGCPSLWLLSLGQARESNSPVRGETKTQDRHANDLGPEINSAAYRTHKLASPMSIRTFPKLCEEPLDCRLRGNDGIFRPSQAMPGLDSSSNQTPLFTLLQMRVRTRSIFSGMASRVYSLSITDSGG